MKRILLVDDESDVCLVLREVLSENGFVVDSYENPTLALEKFKAHSFDLVVLDIKMPDLHGLALYREIQHDCRTYLPNGKTVSRTTCTDYDFCKLVCLEIVIDQLL